MTDTEREFLAAHFDRALDEAEQEAAVVRDANGAPVGYEEASAEELREFTARGTLPGGAQ